MLKVKFIVYFGLDKKPCKKDIAVKCYNLSHAQTQLGILQYLGFEKAYIVKL